jgi:hypothetical protein
MPELLFSARVPLLGAADLQDRRGAVVDAARSLALSRLQALSSGGVSSATLRAMGHPYATRDPRPPGPDYLVNAQSGRYRAGWQVSATMTGDTLTVTAENSTSYARFLRDGTRFMISRPLAARVRLELTAWLGRFLAGRARR